MNRALKRMADYVAEEIKNPAEKIVAISHCNCPERAQFVKEEIAKRISVKDFLQA